jgi:hypothetical protein
MVIDTECPPRQELRRSETLLTRIGVSNIPLLRSYEDSKESADYKHYVPPGLVVYG